MDAQVSGWMRGSLHASLSILPVRGSGSLAGLGSRAAGRGRFPPAPPRPTPPFLAAPPRPAAPFLWPLPAQVPTPPHLLRLCSGGGEASRSAGGTGSQSRAGVGAAAGTLGGGAGGTAMGVEIETISPGDGTGRRSRGRGRVPGGAGRAGGGLIRRWVEGAPTAGGRASEGVPGGDSGRDRGRFRSRSLLPSEPAHRRGERGRRREAGVCGRHRPEAAAGAARLSAAAEFPGPGVSPAFPALLGELWKRGEGHALGSLLPVPGLRSVGGPLRAGRRDAVGTRRVWRGSCRPPRRCISLHPPAPLSLSASPSAPVTFCLVCKPMAFQWEAPARPPT